MVGLNPDLNGIKTPVQMRAILPPVHVPKSDMISPEESPFIRDGKLVHQDPTPTLPVNFQSNMSSKFSRYSNLKEKPRYRRTRNQSVINPNTLTNFLSQNNKEYL